MMHKIYFYQDIHGREPILDYMMDLAKRKDKDSRIKLNKIQDYISLLSEHGLRLGEPYIKRIDRDIWELRPIRDRIFFVCWVDGCFVLLHHFVKRTQKTPVREIAKAKNIIDDMKKRGVKFE